MTNQIYVEKLIPPTVTKKYPLVFIHGAGQTATNFLDTPDGRPGWASYFLSQGYIVYLSDQPSRGRSPWLPSTGEMIAFSTADIENLFTATSTHNQWPQSHLHTQWPGTGRAGDPIFDRLYATQIQLQADELISEAQNAKAYTALLDKIGIAHLITHSQSGPYGWRVADLRPNLVKSIVALEPGGPPFEGKPPFVGIPRLWGITYHEVSYEPSAGPNGTLLRTMRVPPKDVNSTECIMQTEPAKQLDNLAKVPVLVMTGEASYHVPYEYCTVDYLRQAGVKVDFVSLGEVGIHGNGHMFFMEKNNLEIAEKVSAWLRKN